VVALVAVTVAAVALTNAPATKPKQTTSTARSGGTKPVGIADDFRVP
jgi:hypothetical protein